MKKIVFVCAALLVSCLATPNANADAVVQSFVGGGGPFGSFFGSAAGDVVGFRFTADETGFLTALGVTNATDNSILNSAHDVGVWRNSDMALLGMATVDGTGTFDNGWFYEDVAPIAITAGEQYTLGALYTVDDGDTYWSGPSSIALAHVSATNGVSPLAGELGFVYPETDSTNLGRLGPNAIFSSVPEPGTIGILAFAGLGLLARRRRVKA